MLTFIHWNPPYRFLSDRLHRTGLEMHTESLSVRFIYTDATTTKWSRTDPRRVIVLIKKKKAKLISPGDCIIVEDDHFFQDLGYLPDAPAYLLSETFRKLTTD